MCPVVMGCVQIAGQITLRLQERRDPAVWIFDAQYMNAATMYVCKQDMPLICQLMHVPLINT